MEGRGIEIDQQSRPGRDTGTSNTGMPDILTDGQANRNARDVDHARFCAGAKMALFVEDAVVGEFVLAIGGHHTTATQQRGGIVEALAIGLRVTDDHIDSDGLLSEPLERLRCVADESGTQQQVLRRVSGQGQFREDDGVRPGVAGAAAGVGDALDVAVEITDPQVDLGESEDQGHGRDR